MVIGIDASRAFLKNRTGIEEYSYQVIKHLREELKSEQVVLYVKKNFKWGFHLQEIDFDLPKNWSVKGLWVPRFWTQFRLSLEMLFHSPDVLFIPAHTVPFIHPKNTVVTVHGLEYEFCPGAYSFWERWYMRISIRCSVRWAQRIVAVSENTKRDLMQLYGVRGEKIEVVYEGYEQNFKVQISNVKTNSKIQNLQLQRYLLFIGRLEERKNVVRVIEAFDVLKTKYNIPHQLVLAGRPGYGYEKIRLQIADCRFKNEIQELGYVSEEEKWGLLKKAEVFVFPSLYEGFGIPVLEAQSVGTPVVTANISSLPEVGGDGALYIDPQSPKEIAEGIWKVLSDEDFRGGIIRSARENVGRFSWNRCAIHISNIFLEK